MANILELRNLCYQYGVIRALKGINVDVGEGEIVTLIGANGAGKTTTLRAISSLIPPTGTSGKIFFQGADITKAKADKIAGMGVIQVLEGRHIFPRMTVEENLKLGAFKRKDNAGVKEDIERMYSSFPRLKERRKQEGGTLSGGEQQMLAIARGLMANPKLLMLDEPSLGLAPLIVAEIFEIIVRINRESGISILLVEQNSNMALQTAHRAYVLETGEVSLSGRCSELMDNEDVKKSYLGG